MDGAGVGGGAVEEGGLLGTGAEDGVVEAGAGVEGCHYVSSD